MKSLVTAGLLFAVHLTIASHAYGMEEYFEKSTSHQNLGDAYFDLGSIQLSKKEKKHLLGLFKKVSGACPYTLEVII